MISRSISVRSMLNKESDHVRFATTGETAIALEVTDVATVTWDTKM